MKIDELLESIEAEENRGAAKSSHTTNPTTCSDVRRSGNSCGICGSFNIVEQGVRYCITCEIEEEDLQTSGYWWDREKRNPICNCPDTKHEVYVYKTAPRRSYYIGKCLDCGAVESINFCPNCRITKKRYYYNTGTWKHWDGRIKCGNCGFTIDEPIVCSIKSKRNKAQGKLGTRKAKEKMSRRKRKRLEAKNKPHPNKIK